MPTVAQLIDAFRVSVDEMDRGPELILVQAKHPDHGNQVGLNTVKLLDYQVVTENATRRLVMTDSTFTRGALQQIEAYRFQMEGADGARIRQG